MSTLKDLSDAELAEVFKTTEAEVARRHKIQSAISEISEILEKYDIELSDIVVANQSRTAGKRTRRKSAGEKIAAEKNVSPRTKKSNNDRRSKVKPKYYDPSSKLTWSGRGRSPSWVTNICKRENLSLEEFKSSEVYSNRVS